MRDVIVIGGGLSGLVNSILLSKSGLHVLLIEKNKYPFHRVCGEYISNEVIPFLKKHDLFPEDFSPSNIKQLHITDVNGKGFYRPLGLGGFGISRFILDQWWISKAKEHGVEVLESTKVDNVLFNDDYFDVKTSDNVTHQARLVISAHGKRSTLDKTLERAFINKRSPYVGVKYHIKTDMPKDLIALHNFQGGYCGVSAIENDKYNLCYLVHRDEVRLAGSIENLESSVLSGNQALSAVLQNAEKLFEKPEVINEITFDKKEPVHEHIFMVGDAAGMITPLCGNGMAMAIGGAKLLSEAILDFWKKGDFNRSALERAYIEKWNTTFSSRLWAGRQIQRVFFGSPLASKVAVTVGKRFGTTTDWLVKQTHGQPFE